MKIYIDTKPLTDGNAVRGVGYYTQNLVTALTHYQSDIELVDDPAKADIVHYPYFDLFFPTLPLLKIKPTLVTIHDVIPLLFKEHFPVGIRGMIMHWRQRLALTNVKGVVTVSEQSKKDIHHYLGVPNDKISVAYLAVSNEFQPLAQEVTQPIKEKYGLPDRYLLYVGDVNYNKNLPRVIQAFSQAAHDANLADVHLILVGKAFLNTDLPEVQAINSAISQSQVADRIQKLGFVPEEDLPALFNRATVYIQASVYEGFGIPVLQAMQCGTPVIAASTSSLPEVGGRAPYYVNPANSNDISQGISVMVNDQVLRHQLRTIGIEQAKHFTSELFATKVVSTYQSILSAQKVRGKFRL